MLEPEDEARLVKLEAHQEYLKDWVESEIGNYVRRQDHLNEEIQNLNTIIQGKGEKAGVLEGLRNIKRQQKIIGLTVCGLITGSELGAFKALLGLLG